METNETLSKSALEKDAMDYFLGLKKIYAIQREPYEEKWKQARAAAYMTDDLATIYNGRSKIKSPIMKWKVKGINSRVARIIFGTSPIGRLEDKKLKKIDENIVDLWNKYIFEHQLDAIDFKSNFKKFQKNKTIVGTAFAKITQEFEEREVDFFDDGNPETFVIKDDTYFRPILETEFYSDVSKYDINESQACIHSTTISIEELRKNRKRMETDSFELTDPDTGEVVGIEEKTREVGLYHNLDLLEGDGKNLTVEQEEYIELFGLNKTASLVFQKGLKETKKTGFVAIDECYGKLFKDGEEKEVICAIANGTVVIRLDDTEFRHRKYIRPFIAGRNEPVLGLLYGESNVIAGHNLLLELNASRAQASDAKTRSVAPMWYEDTLKAVNWDKVWRPNGIVKGQGQNGITPMLNPYLGNVTNQDTQLIQRDIDQLFSLSPVQEGTTDNRSIPSTARGTLAVIQQNDMPLNDLIDTTIEEEIKVFIEMLYERNITFKKVEDLLTVWTVEDIKRAGITDETKMKELFFHFNVKILGNLELSNEIAHQQGYTSFLNFAQTIPPIAQRLDWKTVAEKMLKSFGIKDDAEGLFLDEELVQQAIKAKQEQDQKAAQAQEAKRQELRGESKEDYKFQKETEAEKNIVEMQAEAAIEGVSGQKVS